MHSPILRSNFWLQLKNEQQKQAIQTPKNLPKILLVNFSYKFYILHDQFQLLVCDTDLVMWNGDIPKDFLRLAI